MAESKKVTVFRAGGTASVEEVDVFLGDTVEQLITLVASQLGLPAQGNYRLLGPDGNQITGDVYKAVKEGDKLTLAQVDIGG